MEVIEPQVIIETTLNSAMILFNLERYGRTAYKSEDKITPSSAEKFIRTIIKSGHESVLEHESISVRFICDRGITHELVRHRIAAYTQESTRYVNYTKKGMQFIKPPWGFSESDLDFLGGIEHQYNKKINEGQTPQQARAFLPNCLKTEIVATMNIREWRHVLRLRTSEAAHPQMREIMCQLLDKFKQTLPVLFDDIQHTLVQ